MEPGVWVTITVAFFHGLFVIVGLYVAFNTRLVKIESKLDILWTQFLIWIKESAEVDKRDRREGP